MATGETNSTMNVVSFNNAHNFITVKLSRRNCHFWKAQITLFLDAQNLLGYVDGTHECPSPTGPDYAKWVQQDKLIMSLLIGSLTEEAFRVVIHCKTSHETCACLNKFIEAVGSNTKDTEGLTDNAVGSNTKDTEGLTDNRAINTSKDTEDNYRQVLFNTHLIAATLIATITFAAGFTVPGGYDGNEGPNQGLPILARKAAFQAFVVSDTIAMVSSVTAVFLHFVGAFHLRDGNDDKAANRYCSATFVTIIAMIAMMVAFMTGLYTVLAPSFLGLAITVCFFGSSSILVFLWLFWRFIKGLFWVDS